MHLYHRKHNEQILSLRIFITEDIMNRVEIYIFLSFKHTTQVGTDAPVWKPLPAPPRGEKKPHPQPQPASPPSPFRMERGVDSIIYKQRGRLFDVKRRPLHSKETPSSIGEGRSFLFALSFFANEALSRYTGTI